MKRFLLSILSKTEKQMNMIDERLCQFCFDIEDISKEKLFFLQVELSQYCYNRNANHNLV